MSGYKNFGPDQNKDYTLRCYVESNQSWWKDGKDRQNKSVMIFLVPDDSTEKDLFLSKYLSAAVARSESPAESRGIEMTVSLAHPVNRRIRVSFQNPNKFCSKPHLHVMDQDAIKVLQELIRPFVRSKVTARVISEAEEARIAHSARG